jgi:hypothetical protein
MNKLMLLASALIFSVGMNGQVSKKAAYDAFDNMVGGEWHINAASTDGTPFKQQVKVEWGAGNAFFTSSTTGIVDKNTKATGVRNQGMRMWDANSGSFRFWECDAFGGITEGSIVIEGNDILYVYEYEGKIVTEAFMQKNKNTYEYIVGVRSSGVWTDVFINGGVMRK